MTQVTQPATNDDALAEGTPALPLDTEGHPRGTQSQPPVGRSDQTFKRFFLASLAGLTLQWGTAGGAIIIHYFTPTIGLGCRSLNWLLYAGVSTLVWILLVISNLLAGTENIGSGPSRLTEGLSNFIRVSAQLLAACNGAAIIVSCVVQFGSFYSRCYCNSVVTRLGSKAYNVFWVRNVGDIVRPWVGGIALGTGSALLFLATVHVWLPRTTR